MVVIDELTENNLILFAAQNYRKPNFSDIEEFYEDLKRFKYVKRLVKLKTKCCKKLSYSVCKLFRNVSYHQIKC